MKKKAIYGAFFFEEPFFYPQPLEEASFPDVDREWGKYCLKVSHVPRPVWQRSRWR